MQAIEQESIEIQVLDDHILHTLAGTLITTTWEFFYGDIQQSIADIKEHYFQYAAQRSLVAYEDVKAIKRSDSDNLFQKEIQAASQSKLPYYKTLILMRILKQFSIVELV